MTLLSSCGCASGLITSKQLERRKTREVQLRAGTLSMLPDKLTPDPPRTARAALAGGTQGRSRIREPFCGLYTCDIQQPHDIKRLCQPCRPFCVLTSPAAGRPCCSTLLPCSPHTDPCQPQGQARLPHAYSHNWGYCSKGWKVAVRPVTHC
jgi:hypothetical protein